VVSFANVQVVETGKGNMVLEYLLVFKHAFMQNIEAVIPEPYVGLSEGLLLGVKQGLGNDLEDAFRKTGIIHIVVLSGYNIMLVVLFVMYLLALIVPMRFRLLFGAISIFLFACMVGLSPTVMRASAMALLLLLAQATERTYAVLRALVVTGTLMLVLNPYLLVYDVGFQFSFIATLGLILVSPYLASYVTFMPTWFKLREFLTATLATQIFITPLLLYQMGQFSVVAIIVNLLVLPMVPVAMLFTFITGVVGFVSTSLSVVCAYLAYLSLAYIIVIAQAFAKLPFASYVVPAFPFCVVVIVYLLYAYILWRLYVKISKPRRPTVPKTDDWTVVEEQTLAVSSKINKESDIPIFFR
jgi:competence protein ComEC